MQEDQVALQERGSLFSNPQAVSGIPTVQVSTAHLRARAFLVDVCLIQDTGYSD